MEICSLTGNSADHLTRGMSASTLICNDQWWKGPEFLQMAEGEWPENRIEMSNDAEAEQRKSYLSKREEKQSLYTDVECSKKSTRGNSIKKKLPSVYKDNFWYLNPLRFSSWLRLIRLAAWTSRFLENCRIAEEKRSYGELTLEEIKDAEAHVIRNVQQDAFASEYHQLLKGQQVKSDSKLISLLPRIDEDGLLRCNGRLRYIDFLPYDARYPIVRPRKNWVTKLIVKFYHEKDYHAGGTNQKLAAISSRFWIISAREEIRKWENECNWCKRRKAKACTQIMAPLASNRSAMSFRAFERVAVDYGGPFITIQGRGKRRQKRYLCLFTCLATRAVHLEMVFALDTDSFLNAFCRMISLRGNPEEVFSDNGGNFVAADKELQNLVKGLDQDRIIKNATNRGIKWNFNPPLSPHFRGAHEITIKASKRALKAILTNANVSDEELMTAIIGAESLLNSRPLTYQTANVEDDVPLTPNHFLHGQMGGTFAPELVDQTAFSPQKRWRRVQELVKHFWQRWLKEWLLGLNPNTKWHKERKDLQVGNIVIVISPDSPRGHWPLAKSLKYFLGKMEKYEWHRYSWDKNY